MALESPVQAHPEESGVVELDTASLIRGWLDGNRMRGVLAGLGVALMIVIAGNVGRSIVRGRRRAAAA